MLSIKCYALDEGNVPYYICELRAVQTIAEMTSKYPSWPSKEFWNDKIHGAEISTVFFGVDETLGAGKPLLFKTVILCDDVEHPFYGWYKEKVATFGEAGERTNVRWKE